MPRSTDRLTPRQREGLLACSKGYKLRRTTDTPYAEVCGTHKRAWMAKITVDCLIRKGAITPARGAGDHELTTTGKLVVAAFKSRRKPAWMGRSARRR